MPSRRHARQSKQHTRIKNCPPLSMRAERVCAATTAHRVRQSDTHSRAHCLTGGQLPRSAACAQHTRFTVARTRHAYRFGSPLEKRRGFYCGQNSSPKQTAASKETIVIKRSRSIETERNKQHGPANVPRQPCHRWTVKPFNGTTRGNALQRTTSAESCREKCEQAVSSALRPAPSTVPPTCSVGAATPCKGSTSRHARNHRQRFASTLRLNGLTAGKRKLHMERNSKCSKSNGQVRSESEFLRSTLTLGLCGRACVGFGSSGITRLRCGEREVNYKNAQAKICKRPSQQQPVGP
ncbi:hypothetical protein TRVL_09502 [Trypanosoma vivax]|nr:hypothetical protein TRVL_09502 [Trypanosoma vivax]